MTDAISNANRINQLRSIPAFVDFACSEMASNPDFWRREVEFGDGIMRAAAIAVVEIGGDQK